MDKMFRLAEFQYDELIPDGEVMVLDESLGDEVAFMSRDEAIALAHAKGRNLVASQPGQDSDGFWCGFRKVTLPLRWETLPAPNYPQIDERMWFEAFCGGRDFLLDDNGHTFTGRMLAWCPHESEHHVYSVSSHEMGEMSTEARYFVRGFLAGNEPSPPTDDRWEMTDEDAVAYEVAVRRFRETGSWYGRWGTCEVCGCVLLPDSASDRCHEHEG